MLTQIPEIPLPKEARQGQNFGELMFMLAVGGIVASLVGSSLWRADKHYLRVATTLFAMLGAFAFFSIFVDQLYFGGHWLVDKAIGALEDGGEQVVMSVITWYVFQLSLHEKDAA